MGKDGENGTKRGTPQDVVLIIGGKASEVWVRTILKPKSK